MKFNWYFITAISFLTVLLFQNCGQIESGSATNSSISLSDQSIPENFVLVDDMILSKNQVDAQDLSDFFGEEPNLETDDKIIQGVKAQDAHQWPGGILPLVFDQNITLQHRRIFLSACADFTSVADVGCKIRTGEQNYVRVSYLTTGSGAGRSFLGRVGGEQTLLISSKYFVKPLIQHELMHTWSVEHEHNRYDRDNHIDILTENIKPGAEKNFVRLTKKTTSTRSYDYDSIMHYYSEAFSKNGKATILSKQGQKIDYNQNLSSGDEAILKLLYGPPQDKVVVQWGSAGQNLKYSIDARVNGEQINACVGKNIVGSLLSFTFEDSCPSKNRIFSSLSSLEFRVCGAPGGNFKSGTVICSPFVAVGGQDSKVTLSFPNFKIRWRQSPPRYHYFMDIQVDGQSSTQRCLSSENLKTQRELFFNGNCVNLGRYVSPKTAKVRICGAPYGRFSAERTLCTPFSKINSAGLTDLVFPSVRLFWNSLGANYQYSVDVKRGGEDFSGCIGTGVLGQSTIMFFAGHCISKDTVLEVKKSWVRVCAAPNGNFKLGQTRCSYYQNIGSKKELKLSFR